MPGLVVSTRVDVDAGADSSSEDRAMALAIASMPPEERRRLREAIDYAAARLEARVMPGGDDLGEGDPIDELRNATAKYDPALNAARSLSRREWRAQDLVVRGVASCANESLGPTEKCVPLWTNEPEGNRARFLAWAASSSAVFETNDVVACARELRDAALRSSSIALVLLRADFSEGAIPERDALKDAAHRLGRALVVNHRDDDGKNLESLGRAAPDDAATRWLTASLPANAIVVVPRLSALTRRAELLQTIERSPACRDVRWLHRAAE